MTGDDRKPPAPAPKPEAPTRKARKFELEAVLAEQERRAKSPLYVDDEEERTEVRVGLPGSVDDDEEERTQIRKDPRALAGYVPPEPDDDPPEQTGRAYYNPPAEDEDEIGDDAIEEIDDARATIEPPRHDTQPVPPAATAPLAPPIQMPLALPVQPLVATAPAPPPPSFAAPPRFVPSVPPAVPAIPPGPHDVGAYVRVPLPPAVPLDGDELAAITRDFQRRRRRVFAVVAVILAVIVIAILVHEPLLEAVRGR